MKQSRFKIINRGNDYSLSPLRKLRVVTATVALTAAVSFISIEDVDQLVPIGEIVKYDSFSPIDMIQDSEKPRVDFTEAAKKYLTEHPSVDQIVSVVTEKAPFFFCVEMLLVELITDPAENYSSIRVSVVCHESLDEALEKLRRFDNNWWLDYEAMGKNYVSIDVMPNG